MKKKFLLVVPICAAVLVGAFAVFIYAAEASKKPDSKSSDVVNVSDEQSAVKSDYYSEEIAKRYKAGGEILTDEQIQKIAQLYRDQNLDPDFYGLPYQECIITGKVDPNAPKLDLAAAKKIIAEHNDFEEILSGFGKVQKAPDLSGGSGVLSFLYRPNGDRSEEILVVYEQGDIYYSVYNPDGTLKSDHLLYGYGYAYGKEGCSYPYDKLGEGSAPLMD